MAARDFEICIDAMDPVPEPKAAKNRVHLDIQAEHGEHEAAEHRAVLQAAEDGDAERAAALLSGHITSFVARNFPEPQENQNV